MVRLSAFGDVIHSAHAVCGLKHSRPDLKVGWLVEDRFAGLVRVFGFVDEVLVLSLRSGLGAALRSLAGLRRAARGRYDTVVDLQGLLKSAGAARLCVGSGRLVGFTRRDARECSGLFYSGRVSSWPALHAGERQARLLSAATGSEVKIAPRLPVALPPLRFEPSRPYVVLAAASAWPNKVWPPRYFCALAEMFSPAFAVYVAGTAQESELVNEITAHSPAVAAPPMSLPELAAFLASAAGVVGSDTGPVHLASGLGVPVVALFGPTDPERTRPLGPRTEVLRSDIDCAGCLKKRCSRNRCTYAPCMQEIAPQKVAEALASLVERAEASEEHAPGGSGA